MTLLPPTESGVTATGSPQVGLLAGRWTAHDQLCLPIDDCGVRQAATAVERLRTYAGNVFQRDAHLDRWQHTIDEMGIQGLPRRQAIEAFTDELISRNQQFVREVGDFGITMFATPGRIGQADGAPTFCMHLNAIDHARNRRRRERGQSLVVTEICQPPAASWPRSIKVRCRLHYFLADQIAQEKVAEGLGVLVDHDGSVTETSVANLAIVEQGHIVSPIPEAVLGGITQKVIQQLAGQAAIGWSHGAITPQRLAAADEVLLMGTDSGIWFANQVDSVSVSGGRPGEIYLQLRDAFDTHCGRSA